MTTSGLEWVRARSEAPSRVISLGKVAFAAVIAAGLIARLVGFATAAMSPTEAGLATSSLALTLGQAPELWVDPTQQTLTTLLFFLMGASDGIARIVPLVAGVGTVWLVWWARPLLATEIDRTGSLAAIIAGGLLALSALAVSSARHLGGEAVATFCALAVVVLWQRYRAAPSAARLRLLAVAYAALLLAGPAGFQTGVILLALVLIAATRNRGGEDARLLRQLVESRRATAIWLVPVAAVIALLSTALLLFPGGIGLPSVGAWGARFEPDPSPAIAFYPIAVLLAYEPAIALLAVVGGWLVLRRTTPQQHGEASGSTAWLVAWAFAEIGLAWLATTQTAGAVAAALVPLALLGGIGGATMVNRARSAIEALNRQEPPVDPEEEIVPAGWRIVAIAVIPLLAAVGFAYVVLGFFSQPNGLFKEFGPAAILIAVILLVGFLAVAIQRLGNDSGAVLGTMLAGLAVIASMHAMSALNYDERPELARPAAASPELKLLADRIVEVADRLRGRSVTIAIDPALRQPFAWYLRDVDGVSFVRQTQPGPTIVVLQDPPAPTPGRPNPFAAYQSHRARASNPTTNGIDSVTGWWRWWAFREGPAGTPTVVGYFSRQ